MEQSKVSEIERKSFFVFQGKVRNTEEWVPTSSASSKVPERYSSVLAKWWATTWPLVASRIQTDN